jgi:hypothetical protein
MTLTFPILSVLLISSTPRGPPLMTFLWSVLGRLRGARNIKRHVRLVSQLPLPLPSQPLLQPRVVPSGTLVSTWVFLPTWPRDGRQSSRAPPNLPREGGRL